MTANQIYLSFRGALSLVRNGNRYAAERRARKIAEKRTNIALEYERNELSKLIRHHNLNIGMVEMTNALGYFIHRGGDLIEAHQKYRSLLEEGGRYPPVTERKLSRYGEVLRLAIGMPTPQEEERRISRHYRRQKTQKWIIFGIVVLFPVGCAMQSVVSGGLSMEPIFIILIGSAILIKTVWSAR